MHVIKRLILIALIGFTLIWGTTPKPIYASEKIDDLWQKAVQIAAKNQNTVPGKSHMFVKEMNRQGKVKKEEEIWLQMTADPNNQFKVECLKALENGKEVTEQQKDKYSNITSTSNSNSSSSKKSNKRTLTFGNDDLNPFDPKVQSEVFYHPTGQRETISQQECLLYEYTWKKNAEQTRKGTAWLAVDTGMPIFIKFTLDPKPKYIKSYIATASFAHQSDGTWYPETGEMEASGGFWFVHFHVKIHFRLSDYWQYQQDAADNQNIP